MPGVLSCTAVLTAERAPGGPRGAPARRRRSGARRHAPAQQPLVPGVKAIIAVASGKGGVGKSTDRRQSGAGPGGDRPAVGLLDADIYGPSHAAHARASPAGRPRADGKKLRPMETYGVKVMSMGFLVDEDTPMIWRGPMVQSALQQMLGDVAWGELDMLVVDMPPGTGDAQLTMAQQVPLAGAVIVSTPQDIALLDARKALNMFRKVDVPVLGIVENMSYFCCPNCGHRSRHLRPWRRRGATAERLGIDFLGEIPLDLGDPRNLATTAGRSWSAQPAAPARRGLPRAGAHRARQARGRSGRIGAEIPEYRLA